jgi:hypothetical protein
MQLSKDQILEADDLGLLEVQVPEWKPKGWKPEDGEPSLYIRVMSVGERDAYEREWIGKKETGVENFRAKFLQRVLCDKEGKLLFTQDETTLLANKSARVMARLWDKAMKHNALLPEDVEEMAKN